MTSAEQHDPGTAPYERALSRANGVADVVSIVDTTEDMPPPFDSLSVLELLPKFVDQQVSGEPQRLDYRVVRFQPYALLAFEMAARHGRPKLDDLGFHVDHVPRSRAEQMDRSPDRLQLMLQVRLGRADALV